jgi:hypothetical protein
MGIHMKNNINYTGATSLNTLRDVVIDSPATGQGIVWDEEKQQWTNGEVSTNDMVEVTLAEYEALSTEEKNNDTTYFITDADNIDPGNVGTAGTLKPWLYDIENEVVIGVYDGKPLYRRIINITPSTSIGLSEYNHNIENADYIHVNTADSFILWDHGARTAFPYIGYADSDISVTYSIWLMNINTSIISIYQGIDRSAACQYIITIEYTKTTDAENSGVNLMPYSFVQNGGGGCNYSTEEQVIGKWIDGRPIYQKTVYIESLPNYSSIYLADDYYDEVISMTGFARHKEALTWSVPLPYTNDSGQNIIIDITKSEDTTLSTRCIRITSPSVDRSNMYGYVTIQYTKTTD